MIIRKIGFLVCMLVVCSLNINTAMAQSRSYEGVITVNPVRLEQKGDFIHVDIDFVLNNVKVKSARGMDFIPRLVTPGRTQNLPKVSIKGRDEYLAYERELALMNAKEKRNYEKPYIVEKAGKLRNDTIRYQYLVPFESWMKDARLDVQRDECGGGEREEIQQRDIQAECFLDFEVNKVNIRPEYMNNPQELAKIRKMIDELKSDPNVKVNRLDIIGYASPEGTLAANNRRSEGRAMALRDYLAYRYDFPRNQYYIVFGGENWDGLEKALETIELEYKDEVLDIIRNIPIEKGRETKLMQLHGGTPYRYLLKYIFPSLRVAICKVNYEVRDFSVEEAKEITKTRPQNLSLNEMFLVANTYPTGSQEFIDVFETAVRMYPQSEIANINAATAALSRNDLVSAERYLSMVNSNKNLPEYNNAMGILMLMKGDYELSKKYLKVAEQSGLDAARGNLEELVRKKANAAEMRKNGK